MLLCAYELEAYEYDKEATQKAASKAKIPKSALCLIIRIPVNKNTAAIEEAYIALSPKRSVIRIATSIETAIRTGDIFIKQLVLCKIICINYSINPNKNQYL